MSDTINFKGKLAMGEEDRIKLSTIDGKTGYKIKKFQILSATPGVSNVEMVAQIFTKSQIGSIGPTVNFTNSELLAVATYFAHQTVDTQIPIIIFDNTEFNQDIYISMQDADGNTVECNYYIELEKFRLNDIQATQLTLQNIRTITSR